LVEAGRSVAHRPAVAGSVQEDAGVAGRSSIHGGVDRDDRGVDAGPPMWTRLKGVGTVLETVHAIVVVVLVVVVVVVVGADADADVAGRT
jgi:hypothetical protein